MPARRPARPITGPGDRLPPDRRTGRPGGPGYVVRASELGQYAYCRRAWWWRYVVDATPSAAGQALLDRGTARHAAHGRGVLAAQRLRRLALAAVSVAALMAL